MPAGPRPGITAPPLDVSRLGSTRDARAARFIETLTIPSGKGARKPLQVLADQRILFWGRRT